MPVDTSRGFLDGVSLHPSSWGKHRYKALEESYINARFRLGGRNDRRYKFRLGSRNDMKLHPEFVFCRRQCAALSPATWITDLLINRYYMSIESVVPSNLFKKSVKESILYYQSSSATVSFFLSAIIFSAICTGTSS
jgi:hypothetical protein